MSRLSDERLRGWWRPRLRDQNPPVYVYTPVQVGLWEMGHRFGHHMSAQQPWSFPAYRGRASSPARIGVTR